MPSLMPTCDTFLCFALTIYIIPDIRVKYCTFISDARTTINKDRVQHLLLHLGRRQVEVTTFNFIKRILSCMCLIYFVHISIVFNFPLQLTPNGLDLYEGVVNQIGLSDAYLPEHLKADMLKYLNNNTDYFTVGKMTSMEGFQSPVCFT